MTINNMEMGMRIRELRKHKGLRQAEFASNVGITENYLSKIENGIKQPSLELLMNISLLLGASTDYLLLGREKMTEASYELMLSKISEIDRILLELKNFAF